MEVGAKILKTNDLSVKSCKQITYGSKSTSGNCRKFPNRVWIHYALRVPNCLQNGGKYLANGINHLRDFSGWMA